MLAKAVKALSPSHQDDSFLSSHGVDLILGGHDHLYYASKGVTSWENYDASQDVLGAENDNGDVLVAKSGTDFRDLSEIELELSEAPVGSVRRRVITAIKGGWCLFFALLASKFLVRKTPYNKTRLPLLREVERYSVTYIAISFRYYEKTSMQDRCSSGPPFRAYKDRRSKP